MQIVAIRETWPGEKRAGLVPKSVSTLSNYGFKVHVESSIGLGCGYSDREYQEVGAEIRSGTTGPRPRHPGQPDDSVAGPPGNAPSAGAPRQQPGSRDGAAVHRSGCAGGPRAPRGPGTPSPASGRSRSRLRGTPGPSPACPAQRIREPPA